MRKGDVGNRVEICRVGIGDDGISEFLFDVVLLEHTFARASNVHAVPDLLGREVDDGLEAVHDLNRSGPVHQLQNTVILVLR
jgi:hypothetical protein